MNGVLRWSDAVAHFGPELKAHTLALKQASMTTHCVMACRSGLRNIVRAVSCDGEHAERRLIASDVWCKDLDAALANWHPQSSPMLVLVLLNRSPCGDCAHLLAAALNKLNDKYCLTTEKQHFVLGSLGYYHSSKETQRSEAGIPNTFTTHRGVQAMRDAGWRLCTIDFGEGLTKRGKEWDSYLQTLN